MLVPVSITIPSAMVYRKMVVTALHVVDDINGRGVFKIASIFVYESPRTRHTTFTY